LAPLGPMTHLNPLITPSIEMGHREPMTINAFTSSFTLLLLTDAETMGAIEHFTPCEQTPVKWLSHYPLGYLMPYGLDLYFMRY
jgi:hypothetical protein